MLTTTDDHDLMLAVRGGDRQALACLFERHHGTLYNFFRKLGRSRSDSEDLVQDTFMRVLKYANSYGHDGCFAPWLFRIARNQLHDGHRKGPALEDVDTLELNALPQHEPGQQHEQKKLEAALQQALLRLPAEQRELVLLSRVKLLSTEDLARLYDCSTGALKVRLHRSLALLRRHFDELR